MIRSITALTCILLRAMTHAAYAGDDHLLPPELFPSAYPTLLEQRLRPQRFDFGNAIFVPALSPEFSVSVYADYIADQGSPTSHVVLLQSQQNILQASNFGKDPGRVATLPVTRTDVPISNTVAQAVGRAWTYMLAGANRSRNGARRRDDGDVTFNAEATIVIFAIAKSDRILSGQTTTDTELPKVSRLVRVADTLVKYCRSAPRERNAIEKQVRQEAESLLHE